MNTHTATLAAAYTQEAAKYAAYSVLSKPGIIPAIFLILKGQEATQEATEAAKQAAALYTTYSQKAAQMALFALWDESAQAAAQEDFIPVMTSPAYRPDRAEYTHIRKAARIAATGTQAALNALYSAHSITKRDYEEATDRAAAQRPQRAAIQSRINAYLSSQAKAATGRTSQAGISRTGGLYRTQATQDNRRRHIARIPGYGVRSIPIKKTAYTQISNIQYIAAILGDTEPPILAATEAAITKEAAAHIRATEPEEEPGIIPSDSQ